MTSSTHFRPFALLITGSGMIAALNLTPTGIAPGGHTYNSGAWWALIDILRSICACGTTSRILAFSSSIYSSIAKCDTVSHIKTALANA